MRILHVVEATTAGVRRHVFTLASAIDQRRFDALVACPPMREHAYGDAAFVADLLAAGIPTFAVPMTRAIRPTADARSLRDLMQIIRAERVDVVHAHSSKAGVLGRMAARALGVASVYTPHGLFFLGQNNQAKRRFFLLLEQLAGRLSDRIIAVSPGERDLIVGSGMAPADRVVCIENGIAPPVLPAGYDRAAWRALLGQESNAPLIGTVARLSAQKNPRRFLHAAAGFLGNQPDARFVWCGSGELQPEAERLARDLGIDHAVRFLGHREDAYAVMAALDVFWLTSDYEGLPTVLLEAMALGVPVVATDVVGTREVLRGTAGLLVPSHSAESLAKATLMLLNRPDRRAALCRTASAWVAERWNAERMLCETETLYERVIAERESGTKRDHTNLTPSKVQA